MNRSIEQSLLSLLPTHNAALPQPLTELASSLLAQSRHRASTLKAEEETARPYACAHLACERLKTALDLPPIDPRPPIPPRIYKRLFNHLDKILPAAGSTPSRTPAPIGPVVAAGLESVLAPGGQPTGDAWARAHPVAVLGALYIFVWRGVTWPREGEEVDRERYVRFRREVAACLERARREVLVPSSSGAQAGSEEEDGWWDGWEGEGVEELAERERARQDGEREDGAAAAGEAVVMGLVGRPDSMFQERYDYLSERKRKAYAEWKVGILKRIKELEAR
ncbi:52642f57-6ba1-442e-b7a6-f24d893a44bc [Thermothielavioides terrestris]|uniref:52642f57-6ba1-442e-b7a6-f24d893a44bc n=1 Tax=Thermothielavioides terrestris TaxID=2587410 RepID=A0A446BD35_9PEZI|nr:52642f57-6ba1-442e-b7a6-f24d893a44bc [Thermothielavioides terrestris]